MTFSLHAVLLACSVIGLVLVLLGVGLVRKRSHPHQAISTSLKLPGYVELTTGDHVGLVIVAGIVLLALGPLLWDKVPSDVPTPPARPSGPATEPSESAPNVPAVPPPSTGVPAQQSPAPITQATPSAQAPEDNADNVRKAGVWKSITEQINELTPLLTKADSEIDVWRKDLSSSSTQHISDTLVGSAAKEGISTKIDKIRRNLNSLRLSYIVFQDIRDVLEETRLSAGAPPVPGTVFDNLLHSIDGIDGGFSKDLATPYVEKLIDDIQAIRDWQAMALKKAPH